MAANNLDTIVSREGRAIGQTDHHLSEGVVLSVDSVGMFARTISISRALISSASRSHIPTMKARSECRKPARVCNARCNETKGTPQVV